MAGSETGVDVLVELDIPFTKLKFRQDPLGIGVRQFSADMPDTNPSSDAFLRFGDFLRLRTLVEPTALPGAHAYVARLPASRLLEIADDPIVTSVLPNSKLSHAG